MSDPRDRGAAFVAAHGDGLARGRAAVLTGAEPLAHLLERLAAQETGPCETLAVLDGVRGLDAPPARRACELLERAQAEDGSWAPGGAAPEEERIFLTGTLGGRLARTRFARPAVLDSAGDFLAARWSPERVGGFAWHAIAAYAAYFANVPHDASDEVLQWCGRELERGFRARRFDALRTARVFVGCDARALPGARIDSAELVAGLLGEQAQDGGWGAPPESAVARVEDTLEALVALDRLA